MQLVKEFNGMLERHDMQLVLLDALLERKMLLNMNVHELVHVQHMRMEQHVSILMAVKSI